MVVHQPELESSLLPPQMKELLVETPKKLPHAMFNHALWIVLWDNGVDGANVIRLVDQDLNNEHAVLVLQLPLVEKPAKVDWKLKVVILAHALWIVLFLIGPSGQHVPNHAVVDLNPEPEL